MAGNSAVVKYCGTDSEGDEDEEIKALRKRRLEVREQREVTEGWRRRDDICKEVLIYTFEKDPQMFHLKEFKVEDPVKLLKEEIAMQQCCRIKIEDMVLMWAGRVFKDSEDLMPLVNTIRREWNSMGRMTFIMYEQTFMGLVDQKDFDGMQAYFNKIELSRYFIYKSYHNCSYLGFNHLEVATACGNATIVQALLAYYGGFIIAKQQNICGESLAHFAVSVNNVEVMKVLADNAYPVDSTDDLGRTALMQACDCGLEEMVAFLIQIGCNLNFRNERTGMSAIGYAIKKNLIEIVKMLIDAGTNVNDVVGSSGNYSIHMIHYSFPSNEMLTLLLDAGCQINAQNSYGETALHAADHLMYNLDLAKLLLNAGCSVHIQNKVGETALHKAVRCGNHDLVYLLLDTFCHINAQNNDGETVLHVVAKSGNKDIKLAAALIQRGADIMLTDKENRTPSDVCVAEDLPMKDLLFDTNSTKKGLPKLKAHSSQVQTDKD